MHSRLIGKVFWREFPAILGTRLETETRRARVERRLIEYEEYYVPLARWLEVRVFPDGEGLGIHFRDITAPNPCSSSKRLSNGDPQTLG